MLRIGSPWHNTYAPEISIMAVLAGFASIGFLFLPPSQYSLGVGYAMKIEITKLQATLDSAVPLDEHNNVQNLSLQTKLAEEFAQPQNLTLSMKADQEAHIARLRSGQIALSGDAVELLH